MGPAIPKKINHLRKIRYLWVIFVICFFAFAIIKNIDTLKTITSAGKYALLLSISTALARKLAGGFRWSWIIKRLGNSCTIPLRKRLRIYFQSNLASYLPGTYWNIPVMINMTGSYGINKIQTGASIVFEQFLIIASAGLAIIPGFDLLNSVYGQKTNSVWLYFVAACSALILIHPKVFNQILRVLSKKLGKATETIPLGTCEVLCLTIWSLLIWILSGISLLFLAMAFTNNVNINDAGIFVSFFALSFTAGFLTPFAPNGIGIREGILGTLLVLLAIPPDIIILVVALSRFILIIEDLFWGAASLTF